MRNLYTFQRININRKEDVQVYNSQWLRKIGKLRARRNTRIDVKNNRNERRRKGRRSLFHAWQLRREIVALREKDGVGRG